jgi:hypothetical protein
MPHRSCGRPPHPTSRSRLRAAATHSQIERKAAPAVEQVRQRTEVRVGSRPDASPYRRGTDKGDDERHILPRISRVIAVAGRTTAFVLRPVRIGRVLRRRCARKPWLRAGPVPVDLRAGPKRCRLGPEFGDEQGRGRSTGAGPALVIPRVGAGARTFGTVRVIGDVGGFCTMSL